MKLKLLVYILSIPFLSCSQNKQPKQSEADKRYETVLTEREQTASGRDHSVIGASTGVFSFEVKTNNPDFEEGIIPWASIEKPEDDVANLISANNIIIPQKNITIVIDYPLKDEYRFELESSKGFSRKDLLLAISKQYYQLYKEEEETATVKTLPMEKRTMYNRNETNGKYGIWGHDIGDLVLTEIYVYKTNAGKIVVTMNIDS